MQLSEGSDEKEPLVEDGSLQSSDKQGLEPQQAAEAEADKLPELNQEEV